MRDEYIIDIDLQRLQEGLTEIQRVAPTALSGCACIPPATFLVVLTDDEYAELRTRCCHSLNEMGARYCNEGDEQCLFLSCHPNRQVRTA